MDLNFTPYQKRLKAEIEEFCREQLKKAPPGWETGEMSYSDDDRGFAFHRSVVKASSEQGFLNQAWPVEYGGKGAGPIEQLIYMETTGYYNLPANPAHYGQMAFMIMQHGTEQQKQRWLPLMARAEITWTELFSEPNAGSDLASLTSSAVLDGDEWVMNGEKIWTSGAHRADHIFGLVRTDPNLPKHRGITFFATKLGPGIEFRALLSMNKHHGVNRTYINNFRLPRADIVGEVNRGWYTMQAGRNVARVNMIGIANLKRQLEELTEFCKETSIGGKLLAKDPVIRQKLADYAVQLESNRRYAYYVCWLQSKGQDVASEASACGFYWADCAQRLGELGMEIMGMYGPVQDGCRWTPLYGKFQNITMGYSSFSIAGGTTEIRKNVIAQRGLGLPRGS